MGREIRRVPKGWEHPVDKKGKYIPLYDWDYESAAKKWIDDFVHWENGTHEHLKETPELKKKYSHWWEYDTMPPRPEQYRPAWMDTPCYQIYETVTEGTPVSPVFDSLTEMMAWLVLNGYSQKAAENFAKKGWAPSYVVFNGTIIMDIESCALLLEE